ncbi:MAG: DUF2027 domain-containing protein [Bacteroidetes bacterium]|nr:DUF2027 domain-containing protein [Bacteroidota bacterium]
MNYKVGDKVKFLNTKGGGFITKIIDSRMVSVNVEGGFEIPTLISELIRIDVDQPGARFFDETFPDETGITIRTDQPITNEAERMVDLLHSVVKNRSREEISIAFVPHDQKWLITGLIDVFLINNTTYDVLYNFLRRTEDGKYEGIDYGSLLPDSRLLLSTIEREEIGKWTEGVLQFLFHKNRSGLLIPPFNSGIEVNSTKFFRETSYRESPLIEGKGIVARIVSVTEFIEKKDQEAKEKEKGSLSMQKNSKDSEEVIFRYQTHPREALIDLHIHELLEDSSNLEKSEILEFQKNYFIRCLESAILNNFLTVTFIHGVGNGTLREVILELLKEYGGIELFDAPMQKFGVGAIEIRIPHNYRK